MTVSKPNPVSRKERKLRKMVKEILQWEWRDEYLEELIEVAHKIEVRRLGQTLKKVFGEKKI